MEITEVVKALEDKINEKGFATKAEMDAFKSQLEEIKALTDQTAVKSAIDKMEAELAAIKEKGQEEPKKVIRSFADALMVAFEENKEALEACADKKGKVDMTVKTPVTIGVNTTVDAVGSASHYSVTQFTGIISALRKRVLRYLESVSLGALALNKPYAMWIEELDEQGAPIFLGEGAGKPQASVRYEEREKKAAKVAVWAKVTEEMLRYLPQLVSYVQNNLVKRLEIKIEDELFNGLGGANQLSGIVGYATAFTGGGLATTDPTYADVFRALALQVEKAHGIATAVFVRPEILAQMDTEKTQDGHYLLPPFRSPATGDLVAGIRLISSNGVPSGVDFVGGDLSVVNVAFTDGIRVEIDRDGNDFTSNLRTILVEAELVQFVSANDTQVLVKGEMATAIAAITAS
jgi:HK97 family phage major capsid protein